MLCNMPNQSKYTQTLKAKTICSSMVFVIKMIKANLHCDVTLRVDMGQVVDIISKQMGKNYILYHPLL